jgi:quercetin 2,3-dioxygenase
MTTTSAPRTEQQVTIRRAEERFRVDRGASATELTFLPDDRTRPAFRSLLILNEDFVSPGQGFGMHPHRDAEILSYVIEGANEHRDDAGHREVLRAGELQRMSAGTGIWHSEMNPSATEALRYFQIWIAPDRKGLEPGYEQKPFLVQEAPDRLHLLASRDARAGSLTVHADLDFYAASLRAGATLTHRLAPGRHAWLHVVDGSASVHGVTLNAGDGAGFSGAEALEIQAASGSHVLLFDLA